MEKPTVYRKQELVNIQRGELPSYITEEGVTKILEAVEREFYQKETKRGVRPPTEKERKEIQRNKLFIQTLWTTGTRVSEITEIRPADIIEGGIKVFGKRKPRNVEEIKKGIVQKEKRERVIPIPAMLRQNLVNYIFTEKLGSEQRIFPFTTVRAYQIVDRYAKKAGIQQKIHPHMFRHGFAIYLLRKEVPINAVQQLLGHTSLQSTTIYTKLAPIELQKYIEASFGVFR